MPITKKGSDGFYPNFNLAYKASFDTHKKQK